MIIFIISQIFGLILFLAFNYAIFSYMKYKRSQQSFGASYGLDLRFRAVYFLFIFYCLLGLSHKVYSLYLESEPENLKTPTYELTLSPIELADENQNLKN